MLIYTVCSLLAYVLSRMERYALSGFVLILAALYLYIKEYRYSKSLVNLRGFFALAFIGGGGLAAIKLSPCKTMGRQHMDLSRSGLRMLLYCI